MGINHQLLVSPQVEEPARGVVRARGKGVAVGEELHGEEKKTKNGFRFGEELHGGGKTTQMGSDFSHQSTANKRLHLSTLGKPQEIHEHPISIHHKFTEILSALQTYFKKKPTENTSSC